MGKRGGACGIWDAWGRCVHVSPNIEPAQNDLHPSSVIWGGGIDTSYQHPPGSGLQGPNIEPLHSYTRAIPTMSSERTSFAVSPSIHSRLQLMYSHPREPAVQSSDTLKYIYAVLIPVDARK